jgi:hypothetical protein
MSGSSNVVAWLERRGIAANAALVARVLERARASERVLTDAELVELVESARE